MTPTNLLRKRGLRRWLALLALPAGLLYAGTITAQAATTLNETFPVSGTFPNPCIPGDAVTLKGTAHILMHVTVDSNGGYHSDYHFNGQDISGVGTSGTTYSIPETQNVSFNGSTGAEQTITQHVTMISHGSTPNLELIQSFHFTVNANGEVTSFHNHFDIQCRG